MCMMVYLASDYPLPESEWDEQNPAFFVTSNHRGIEQVRRNFSKKHVYYAGSHEECGCGFGYTYDEYYLRVYDEHPDLLSKALQENAQGRVTVQRLRDYLELAVELGPVELYSVLGGNEAMEPVQRLKIDTAYFCGQEFCFQEQWFFVVSKSSNH